MNCKFYPILLSSKHRILDLERMIRNILPIFLLLFSIHSYSQNNDCSIAEVICDGSGISYTPSGPGDNDFADPDNFSGCLATNENQSAWYYFEFGTDMPPNSTLEFTINPFGGFGEDYDFAVFGPDVDCGALGSPIRCSYAAATCAFCPETGLGMGATDLSEAPNGDGFVAPLQVQPGEGYYLLVDNFDQSSIGFSLEWGGDAVPYLNCNAEPPCPGLSITVTPSTFDFCTDNGPYPLNVNIDGTSTNATFVWTGSNTNYLSNPNILTPLLTIPPGFSGTLNYVIEITDGNCEETTPISVTINDLPVANANNDLIIDCNNPNVTLNSGGSSTGPTISYAWFNNNTPVGNGPTLNVSTAGNYSLVVTDQATGCTATDDVLVTDNTSTPVAAGAVLGEINCYTPETVLSVLDPSNPNAIFEWYQGGALIGVGTNIPVSTGGPYTLLVTDQSNGCTASDIIIVTQNEAPPFANPIVSGEISCQFPAVALLVDNPTAFNASYDWYIEGNLFGSGFVVSTDLPGVYTLLVTDLDNGCTYQDSVEVIENAVDITSAPQASGVLNCDQTIVTLDIDTSSQGAEISYSWLDPSNNEISTDTIVDVSEAGIYTLIVTDNTTGCTTDAQLEVFQDLSTPEASIESSGILTCDTTSVALSAMNDNPSGNDTYQWFNDSGNVFDSLTSTTAFSSGDYELIITNGNTGCMDTATITVFENTQPPTADAGSDGVLNCNNTSFALNGSNSTGQGSLLFEWTDENGIIIGNTVNEDVTTPGEYTLSIIDETNGCQDQDVVNISLDDQAPDVEAGPDTILNCLVTQIEQIGSASGGNNLSFEWQDPQGNPLSSTESLNLNTPGSYFLQVTNEENGCINMDSFSVVQDTISPNISILTPEILTCEITSVPLDASASNGNGSLSFDWSYNGNSIADTDLISVNLPGAYQLLLTDNQNGCTTLDAVMVTQDTTPPIADAGPDNIIDCNNPSITLDAGSSSTGLGLNYFWLNLDGDTVSQDIQYTTTIAGNYDLIVSNDANGCTASDQAEIVENTESPVVNIQSTDDLNCFNSMVMVISNGSSTGNEFIYNWFDSNNQPLGNDQEINVSTPGDYSLIIENSINGCRDTASTLVTQDTSAPQVNISPFDDLLTCSNTSVLLDLNTNAANADFEWQNNSGNPITNTDTLSVIDPGIYQFLVTNTENGCTSNGQVTLSQDIDTPVANAGPDGILTCTSPSVTIDGSGSSIGPDFEYAWFNSANGLISTEISFDIGATETYTLIVTDTTNGCTASDQVAITPDSNLPTAQGTSGGILTCAVNEVSVFSNGSTQGSTIIYDWYNSNNEAIGTGDTIPVNAPGNYTLIVTDNANGCSASAIISVNQDTIAPQIDLGADTVVLTCAEPVLSLFSSINMAGADPVYEWTDDNGNIISTTDTSSVSSPGLVSLQVKNTENGCSALNTIEVALDDGIPNADAGTDFTLTCIDTSFELNASASSQGLDIQYEWFDENNELLSSDPTTTIFDPGTYTLLVTNTSNGCTSSDEALISEDVTLPVADAGSSATLTCTVIGLKVGGNNTSTGSQYSYTWTNLAGDTISDNKQISIGTSDLYTLVVTNDLNGCTDISSVFIDQDVEAPIADAGQDGIITCTEPTYLLGGAGISTGVDFIYEWFNSSGQSIGDQPNFDTNFDDNFELVVTDTTNGCKDTAYVSVLADQIIPTIEAEASNILTCTDITTQIDGSNSQSGTGSSLEFIWEDENGNTVGNNAIETVSVPGNYALLITDPQNGCSDSIDITVMQDTTAPTALIENAQLLTCDLTAFDLMAQNAIGTQLQYEWYIDQQAAGTDPILTISQPATYTLIVNETTNGCRDSVSVQIQQDTAAPTAIALSPGLITCGIQSVDLNGNNSSSGSDFIYAWTNAQGDTLSENITTSTSIPGNYQLIVENNFNGCISTDQIMVNIDTIAPIPQIEDPEILTCDLISQQLDGTSSTIPANFNLNWVAPGGNSTGNDLLVEISDPGIYMLNITNVDNECSAETSIEVFQNTTPPEFSFSEADTLTCEAPQTTLISTLIDPNLNVEYIWENESNITISQQAGANVGNSGVYTLTTTNTANGCTYQEQIEVFQDDELPVVTASVSDVLDCIQTSVPISGSALNEGPTPVYEWYLANNLVGAGTTIPVDLPGVYELFVTNPLNGCSSSNTVEVFQDTISPLAIIQNPDTLTCSVLEITLFSDGSSTGAEFNYAWQNSTGNVLGNNEEVIVDQAELYELIITNTQNGCTSIDQIVVPIDTLSPTAIAGNDGILTCANTSVNLIGNNSSTNNMQYQWLNTQAQPIGQTINIASVSDPGLYTLIVMSLENGCSSSAVTLVDQDVVPPTAIISSTGQLLTCNIQEIVLDGSKSTPISELSYQWFDQIIPIGNDPAISINDSSTFTLIVTNTTNGCKDTASILIEQDEEIPFISILDPETLTCAITAIEIDATASSSGPIYEYSWSGPSILLGSTTLNPTVDEMGSYTLTVTNTFNGCSNTSSTMVPENTVPPLAFASAPETIDCFTPTAIITGEGSSQGPEFSYNWSTNDGIIQSGSNSLNAVAGSGGTYSLLVSNQINGCTATSSTEVISNTTPPSDVLTDLKDPACFGDENGQVFVQEVIGGSSPYLFSINGSPLSPVNTFTNLAPGIYEVLIQDINGCEWVGEVLLEEPDLIQVDLGTDLLISLGESVELEAQVNRFDNELTWVNWSGGIEKLCLDSIIRDCRIIVDTPYDNQVYFVEVMDENGCLASSEILVRVRKDRPVYIPNAFSPDGDGVNDVMFVQAGENVTNIKQFTILDRWGEQIFNLQNFQPNDPNLGWDGTFRGKQLNPSVFVYLVEVEFIDGEVIIFKGDITLVR